MRYYYSYAEFRNDCLKLTRIIDWEFDAIVGIARGGLTLSHMLGEHYNLRSVYTINTIGYDDTQKLHGTQIFNTPDLSKASNILILDDIVDSGETIVEMIHHLRDLYPNHNFKVASLFYKPTATIKPDWYVQIADKWIDFFWVVDLKPKSTAPET